MLVTATLMMFIVLLHVLTASITATLNAHQTTNKDVQMQLAAASAARRVTDR